MNTTGIRASLALALAMVVGPGPLSASVAPDAPVRRPAFPAGQRMAMAFANANSLVVAPSPPPYVGMIACLDPYRRGVRHVATGWLVGAPDTVITAAHTFYKEGEGGVMRSSRLDPARCVFTLSDPSGGTWDIINIRYAVSEWANGRRDQSSDVAVVKLERMPLRSIRPPRLAALRRLESDVHLVAFHAAGADADRPVVSLGQIHGFPHKRACSAGFCVHIRSRMFISCASSTAGSSGGLYLDDQGAAVGLHVGYFCGNSDSVFSQTSCFNYGVFLDAKIRLMIAEVNAGRADASRLIR